MSGQHHNTTAVRRRFNDRSSSPVPVRVPDGHVGEYVLPGTGRLVWWTGRVAIGLRYQPRPHFEPASQSAHWIQKVMLAKAPTCGTSGN